jgi:hypothetical protein
MGWSSGCCGGIGVNVKSKGCNISRYELEITKVKTLRDYISEPQIVDRINRDRYLSLCFSIYKHWFPDNRFLPCSTYLSQCDSSILRHNTGIMACSNTLVRNMISNPDWKVIAVWEDDPIMAGCGVPMFATNVMTDDPTVTSVPLGNDWRSNDKIESFKPSVELNTKLMYVNFALSYPPSGDDSFRFGKRITRDDRAGEVGELRQEAFYHYEGGDWVTAVQVDSWGAYPISTNQYLQDLYEHKFVLCPEGVGIDTFRVWDALYMKSIPIVKKSNHMLAFSDLPILFVDDYTSLTKDLLEHAYNEMLDDVHNFDKLKFSYWENLIKGT